jgi:hypothetical protein
MSTQQFADPLGDGGIQGRWPGHPSSITQPVTESQTMAGSAAPERDSVRLSD